MSDAQMGLIVATPVIAAFAVSLRRMGVLSTTGSVAAVAASVLIAAVLFLTQ